MVKKSSKRQAKANKLANVAKAREARIQKEIPRKVFTNDSSKSYHRAAQVFLKGVLDLLVDRALALQTNTEVPNPGTAAIACHHVTAIGSSQLHKIAQPSFDISSLHNRAYYIGARSEGAKWEDVWGHKEHFYDGKVCYQIQKSFKEPNRFSHDLPWVTATPDFIAELKCKGGDPFWAVIEIKSHVTKRPTLSRYMQQVQVAMDCFNVDVGFLVVYNGNKAIDQCPTILKVKRNHHLATHKTSLNMKYYAFLLRCCEFLFSASLARKSIEEMFQKLTEIEIPSFRLEWESLTVGSKRSACYNNKSDRRLGTRRRVIRKYLSHTGQIRLLCAEETVYVPVDENGEELDSIPISTDGVKGSF